MLNSSKLSMGDRGQAATEFLMVLAVGFLILLPAIVVFMQFSQNENNHLKSNQVVQFGNDIVNKAETVYYYSNPSKMTIEEVLPTGVQNITILSNWSARSNLFIVYMKNKDTIQPLVFSSNVAINGTFDSRSISPGKKRVVLEVKNQGNQPYVAITIT